MSASDLVAPRPNGLERLWLASRSMAASVSPEAWMAVGVTVLAAVVRLLVIDTQSLWQDEALTAFEARIPFGAMVHVVATVETTPPLYFVLIWAWGHVFGTSATALRFPSTLAGVALVPICYLCARELISRRAGVLAAAFAALNPFLIWYSQEARAYMVLTTLCAASLLWFTRARRQPTAANLAWWAVFSALALMTHFFAGFLIAPEAAWLLLSARRRSAARAVAVVAAAQLAMLPFALIDTSHGTSWIAATPRVNRISAAISEWGVSILYRRTPVRDGLLAGAALLAILAALVLVGGDRRTRAAAAVGAGLTAVVWGAPLALAYLGQDYFLSRNLMPAVAPAIILLSAACVAPRARAAGAALAAALLALFSYAALRVQTHPYLERPNWRAVAHALGPATVPRAILAAGGTTADPLKIYLPRVAWNEPPRRTMVIDEVDIVGATKKLPLVVAHVRGPGGRLTGDLFTPLGRPVPRGVAPRGARLIARFRVNNWILARFALAHPQRISVGQLIALAPRFFRATPQALLVLLQPPERALEAQRARITRVNRGGRGVVG
jgi:mannosyltransferase